MQVATSEKTVLKLLWEVVFRNGRDPRVSVAELAGKVAKLHAAGVAVYPTDDETSLRDAIRLDAQVLERLGFVEFREDKASLTGAGQLVASTLKFPIWAEQRLADSTQAHV